MSCHLIYAVARRDVPGRPVDIHLQETDGKGRVFAEELHATEDTPEAEAVRRAAQEFLVACCEYATAHEGEPVVIRTAYEPVAEQTEE